MGAAVSSCSDGFIKDDWSKATESTSCSSSNSSLASSSDDGSNNKKKLSSQSRLIHIVERNGTVTSYKGQVDLEGHPHGRGTAHYENGNVYRGMWKNGKKCGFGTMFFGKTKSQYNGRFHNDTFSGPGEFCWSDGQAYVGDFKNGQMHGYGTYSYSEKYFYKGCYKDGKRVEGKGLWHDDKWDDVSSAIHKNDAGHEIKETIVIIK